MEDPSILHAKRTWWCHGDAKRTTHHQPSLESYVAIDKRESKSQQALHTTAVHYWTYPCCKRDQEYFRWVEVGCRQEVAESEQEEGWSRGGPSRSPVLLDKGRKEKAVAISSSTCSSPNGCLGKCSNSQPTSAPYLEFQCLLLSPCHSVWNNPQSSECWRTQQWAANALVPAGTSKAR